MTGRIVDFQAARQAREESQEQHGVGAAFCIACKHQWTAAVPAGVTEFACPQCERHTGRWCFPFYPSEDQLVRECNCGNQLFYLTPDGHLCANCGIYQSY